MSSPVVVWCNRENCGYNSNKTCAKYNVHITDKGCRDYTGKAVNQLAEYEADERRAWDDYYAALHD